MTDKIDSAIIVTGGKPVRVEVGRQITGSYLWRAKGCVAVVCKRSDRPIAREGKAKGGDFEVVFQNQAFIIPLHLVCLQKEGPHTPFAWTKADELIETVEGLPSIWKVKAQAQQAILAWVRNPKRNIVFNLLLDWPHYPNKIMIDFIKRQVESVYEESKSMIATAIAMTPGITGVNFDPRLEQRGRAWTIKLFVNPILDYKSLGNLSFKP